mgnify:FL=1
MQVWVKRKGSTDGDVSYGELSEGERQLLTVLGLIRLSRNKRTIFLLDEPDTHLNPRWQYDYLHLIEEWAQASKDRCHLILTTHSPLMVGSLHKEQVRVLSVGEAGKVEANQPDDDPIGMGVEGLLKSELFGLRSSLAPEVLTKIDRHFVLLGNERRTEAENEEVLHLAVELNGMGISLTHPNPYFEEFAKARARQTPAPELTLSKGDMAAQVALADELLSEIESENPPSETSDRLTETAREKRRRIGNIEEVAEEAIKAEAPTAAADDDDDFGEAEPA